MMCVLDRSVPCSLGSYDSYPVVVNLVMPADELNEIPLDMRCDGLVDTPI